MQTLIVIASALAPVIVALCYIYSKDSLNPEPPKWLFKAFIFGVLSAYLSFVFSTPTSFLLGLEVDPGANQSFLDAFADAFMLAAIPEELAKLIMLWLLLRKNSFFDEQFDGIVYSVCIGMGFAGIENIMYLMNGIADGSWISTGISRALFSIPGHFLFAVLMGYYYSLYHFGISRNLWTMIMILAAPVIAHGLFDGILFCMDITPGLSVIGMIVFLIFFNKLRKKGRARILALQNR